jgi:YidC/Oxa1 family membrane protein insertase
MASTQKYMAYIMPLFALTGLYWPFGLVLYWCTTNIWTLGQQYLLGRRYPYTPPAADGADTGAAGGGKGLGRTATASALTSGSSRANGKASTAGKPAANGRATASRGSASASSGNGASAAGGGSMLRRLGQRSEPEPPPAEPDVKLVRHQTQRQTRSKRSGGKR